MGPLTPPMSHADGMSPNSNVTMLLAGVLVLAAAIIIITSGESVAVRFLTAVVSLDVATRLVIYGGRRT